jgi:Flp pilus assembly protein TadG
MNVTRKTQRGQIAVVMAIAVAGLVGAMALSTDVGLLYYNWGLLQKAADSSVLAGAQYLPTNQAGGITAASNIAGLNGITSDEIVSTTVAADQNSITINLKRTVPYYLALVVGLRSGQVIASATAAVVSTGAVNHLVPIGIDSRTSYAYGQTITLMTGQYGPGNWGPVDLGGTGASNFNSNLQYGYTGNVSIGQMLSTETGMMVGPTRAAFNARVNAGLLAFPGGTFANHSPNDPRSITVPMMDYANVNGSSLTPVLGFAQLWLSSINNSETITTYFIQQVVGGSPSTAAHNYGAMQVVLIK